MPTRRRPIRVVVPGPEGRGRRRRCGRWPDDLASGSSLEGWKNEPYANFGCATQSTLAAQVDDPRDLVQARALGPSDVAMRTARDRGTSARARIRARTGRPDLTPIGDGRGKLSDATRSSMEAPARDSQSTSRPIAQIDPVPRVSIQAFCESPEVAAVVQAAIADRRMARRMSSRTWAARPRRSKPTAARRRPNVIVLEATADRDTLLEQLDELAEYCDAGTKVIIIGKVNDIVLYRQLIARGVSEYLVAPFERRRFRPGDLAPLPAARRQAARPRRRGGRRQGRRRRLDGRPQSRLGPVVDLTRDGHHHRRSRPRLRHRGPRLQPGSAAGRRRGGVRARPRRRRTSSTGCCRNAATTCSLLAAPATLDRVLRLSARPSFDSLIDAHARLDALDRARRAAWLDGLDAPHPDRRRRGHRRRAARSRQSAQRQEHRSTTSAAPGRTTIRRGWSSTASACRSGRKSPSPISPRPSRSSRPRSFRTTPSCSARPPTTAR